RSLIGKTCDFRSLRAAPAQSRDNIRMMLVDDPCRWIFRAHCLQQLQIGADMPAALQKRLVIFHLSGHQDYALAVTRRCPRLARKVVFGDAGVDDALTQGASACEQRFVKYSA